MDTLRFRAPLDGTYIGQRKLLILWLIEKRVVDFLLVLIEVFFAKYGEVLRAK